MKCSNHNQVEAVATCVFCGSALCPSCVTRSATGRVICSPGCLSGISNAEAALESVRRKTVGSNRLTVYFCFGSGLIFGIFAGYEAVGAVSSGRWDMAIFLGGLAAVFIGMGIAWSRMMAKKA